MNELKIKLSKITDKYLYKVKAHKTSDESLDKYIIRAKLISKHINELSGELIDAANIFMEENNIEDESDAENIITEELQRFNKDSLLS